MKTFPWLRNVLLFAALAALSSVAFAQIGISITIAPPPLPVYEQPLCPAPNYIWTPGYWAWGTDGYFWVPGTWVEAPAVGLLWTPGYWGWNNGRYFWNAGYWGPEVGFYGGVDYGYGYDGDGFYGGRWQGGYFNYNTAVVRVSPGIRRTYMNRTRFRSNRNRVSFNGGRGGIQARPSARQRTAHNSRRFGPITAQTQQASAARNYRQNYARENHGRPAHLATQRPVTSAAAFGRTPASPGARPNPGRRNEARPNAARPNAARPNGARPNATRPNTARPNPARPGARPSPARPENRTNARPATRPGANAHPASRPNNRPEAHPRANTNVRPARQPEPRPATQPRRAEPAPQPAARPQPRAQPRPTPHPEARPQARPQPRPESRPQARPQSRPAPRSETRPNPAAHPQPHEAQPKANEHQEKPHSD